MVGVQMARHWHIVQNEMGILIFTHPLMEEKKKRLTISDGLDDGPDYSSDGKYIYFNSYRTGHMQIWRMQSDGTNQSN
jgi:Tol biopolymer transport system component